MSGAKAMGGWGRLKGGWPRSLGGAASDMPGDSGRATDEALLSWVDHEVENL